MPRRVKALPPRFPTGPEARIKHASISLLVALHADIIRSLPPRPPGAALDPLARDTAIAARYASVHMRAPYRVVLVREAERAAAAIALDTSVAVGRRVPAADKAPIEFAIAAWDKAAEEMASLSDCMVQQWMDGADVEDLQDCLDRGSSRWWWWIHLMFGWMVGATVRETHLAAGVLEAEWVAVDDARTRPAHRALDGVAFSYDGPPPLSAAHASNGEDCWPGDDYNCRCTARPVLVESSERIRRAGQDGIGSARQAGGDDEAGG